MPKLSAEQEALGKRSVEEFTAYLKTSVAGRRKNPGDPERDVLTRLTSDEVGGEMLSEAELLQNCVFILNADHEATRPLNHDQSDWQRAGGANGASSNQS